MKDDYKNKLASKIASRYQDLEERIMQDIVRRIMKAGEITSTADWQINRLQILGYSSEEQWKKLQSKFFAYLEINKKDWSEEFKNTSKQAYDRFAKENVVMSVHALSRLPRLNKPGLPEVSEEMLIKIIKGTPNYTEGEDKQIYFIHELQLLVVRNKKTGDIVSVVRRRAPKEAWGNV